MTTQDTPPLETELDESTVLIPLDDRLHESPFQPEAVSTRGDLLGLAESMRPPHGRVHQPIVVRPASAATRKPGLGDDQWEIVFGHRRTRGARLAGLQAIPALVRDLDDEAVKLAQAVENLQREGVAPLVEADALHALRREHGWTVEQLMQRAGKGRTYVYNQLRLATASDAVRTAVLDGQLDREVAWEVARLPNPMQAAALQDVWYRSSRDARRLLQEQYSCKLAVASFDPLDIKLVPEAGACDACTKRSDVEASLVEQYGPGICLDVACFRTKLQAARAKEAASLPPAQPPAAAPAPKAATPQAAHQAAQQSGEDDDAEHDAGDDDTPDDVDAGPPLTPAEDAVWHRWPEVKRALMREVAARPRTADDLRFLLERELALGGDFGTLAEEVMGLRGPDDEDPERQGRSAWLKDMSADRMATLLMLCAIDSAPFSYDSYCRGTKIAAHLAVCQRFGFDPATAVAPQAAAPVQAPAAVPAPKGVRYMDPLTGSTWTGKGLQPKWLKAALDNGRKLAEFEVRPTADTKTADLLAG